MPKNPPPKKWVFEGYHGIWQGGLIVLLVFLAFQPALTGEFIWDDECWTTNLSGLFQNTSGLYSIWFNPTALQQYYPLSGTSFWLEYQLWGFRTFPYHVDNVLLHALAAVLFWRSLVRLQLPCSWLAGAIFGLHPVMVESVAWITERKNVLSMAFYLGALVAYERFAQLSTRKDTDVLVADSHTLNRTGHSWLFYGLALALFVCALFAKTTAFSLPAVILLICWWKRGKISWRSDLRPTLPFFAIALGLCAVTAWLEINHVGAAGSDFTYSFPQRFLVAGRVFWFYLGKLCFPAGLCFVYPHWSPNPGVWWQWLFPLAALGALGGLWLCRHLIGRGPATAFFYYVGTLFPVLGFMNAYGIRYSFVWDHWVYLSSLGIFALIAASVARVAAALRAPWLACGAAAIVLPSLFLLTRHEAGKYQNLETLWRRTLVTNPNCWLAHNNLGLLLKDRGQVTEAKEHFNKAIVINPGWCETPNNLGLTLAAEKRYDEAILCYRKALQLNPKYSKALNNLGIALASEGRFAEAADNYRLAIEADPGQAEAHSNLGAALSELGQHRQAVVQFQEALQLNPDSPALLNNLAWALSVSPEADVRDGVRAVQLAERACYLTYYRQPLFVRTLAAAYAESGRFTEAVATADVAEGLATRARLTNLAGKIAEQIRLYHADMPYHESARMNK